MFPSTVGRKRKNSMPLRSANEGGETCILSSMPVCYRTDTTAPKSTRKIQQSNIIPALLSRPFTQIVFSTYFSIYIQDHNPEAYQRLTAHQPILDHYLWRADSKKEVHTIIFVVNFCPRPLPLLLTQHGHGLNIHLKMQDNYCM